MFEKKKKLSSLVQKSANNRTSKVEITMIMMTVMIALLLVISAPVVVPVQATILPSEDLPVTIPERDDDDDGAVPVWWGDCFRPGASNIAISNCLTAALFDDDLPPPDPCAVVPEPC
jgi:hypothetical protein